MKALICDKCGAVVSGNAVKGMTRVTFFTGYQGNYLRYHLCDKCAAELARTLGDGESIAAAEDEGDG